MLLIILFVIPDALLNVIWQGESKSLITIAFIAIFFQNQIWTLIVKIGESQRLTSMAQTLGVVIALIHFCLVILFFLKGWLSIEYIYYLITIEILIGAIIAKLVFPIEFIEEKETYKENFQEYWIYCKPLIPMFG